jgi:beta-fructofuranosidase
VKKANLFCIAINIILSFCSSSVLSEVFPIFNDIRDKTLVSWCTLDNLTQQGGSILTIDRGDGSVFDGIVFGEYRVGCWMSGSELWHRTQGDQSGLIPENSGPTTMIKIAIVYESNTIRIYRNDSLYAQYTPTNPQVNFQNGSEIVIGKRHIGAGGPSYLYGNVEEARIYNRALTGAEIASLTPASIGSIVPIGRWSFENGSLSDEMGNFGNGTLIGSAHVENGKLVLSGPDDFYFVSGALGSTSGKNLNDIREYTSLHYWPADKFVGDTICYFSQGKYHVYYLTTRGSWGHIVSTDLVNWAEMPDAITKNINPNAPDGTACWTGSIIERNGLFYLFYTGLGLNDPNGQQKVMLATSNNLINWSKQDNFILYANGINYWNTNINGPWPSELSEAHRGFRDPEVVWNPVLNKYSMFLHCCAAPVALGVIGHYTSDDLIHWTAQPPVEGVSGSDCPHVFSNGSKYYMIRGMDYNQSNAPHGPYSAGKPFDKGCYAVPKGMNDGSRHILMAWVQTYRDSSNPSQDYTDSAPLDGPGIMALPREIHFGPNQEVLQRIPQEVLSYLNKVNIELSKNPVPEQQSGWVLNSGKLISNGTSNVNYKVPADYYLHCNVTLSGNSELSIKFRVDPNITDSGYTLRLISAQNRVELFSKYKNWGENTWPVNFNYPVDIKVFVLGTCIECIINDSYGITMRGYDYTDGLLYFNTPNSGITVNAFQIRTHQALNGDLNDDGCINFADFAAFAKEWLNCFSIGQ